MSIPNHYEVLGLSQADLVGKSSDEITSEVKKHFEIVQKIFIQILMTA